MNVRRCTIRIVFIILVFVSMNTISVFAKQGERRVVKVAYPIQTYLTEIDEQGNYYGYSYEYLKKVAEFANWKLEFITYLDKPINDQLLSAMNMLESKEADLLGGMLQNKKLEEKYLYPDKNYGVVYTTLEVLDNNFNVTVTNYMKLDNLRVAVIKSATTRNEELDTFVKNTNLNCEYVYCESQDEQLSALRNGEADALLKVSLNFIPGVKQIAEFAPRPYYFVSGHGNEELMGELNAAITKINNTDPYFEGRLRAKYFQNTIADFALSEDEIKYVSRNPELKVLILPNYAPFSFVDKKGTLCGMSVSILEEIGKKAGITLKYHILRDEEDINELIQSGKYSLVIGPPHSDTFTETYGLVLSQPYLEENATLFFNRNIEDKPKSECILALIRDVMSPISYEYKEIRYYDNIQKCLEAVNKGEADYGYGSKYIIDFYTAYQSHRNLKYLSLSGDNREIGIYVPSTESSELLTIINKYIRSMPTKDIHGFLSLALSKKDYGGINQLIHDNPLLVIITTITFLFLLLLIFMLFIYNHVNKKRNHKLQIAFSAKSDFLSRMSHDMRTPMNGIMGLTGLTLEIEDLPTEVADNLSKIDESAQYLLSLINDTLDMNKIESNKIILNRESVNLQSYFDQMVSVARISADQKGVALIATQSDGEIPIVYLDKVRVQQIFFNLVSNAIKFTPKHGTVELEWRYRILNENQVQTNLIVRDNGIGISSQFMPKIFEAFEQEYNAKTANYSGTGLGLAIAKNLVDIMGGTIDVTSQKGAGSEFRVEIAFDVADVQVSMENSKEISEDALKGKRVLLCEDHALNAQIATKLLEKKGILVERAENGEIGVSMFERSEIGYYDAILMDIRMPVMNGLEATRAIRKVERADVKTLPIIAMTANAFDEDVKKSIDAGMSAHLAKPINTTQMFTVLNNLIKHD